MAGWSFRKLNLGGASKAPQAAEGKATPFLSGDPFISAYNGQLHVAYGAIDATIWDVWCTPFPRAPSQWNPQRIDKDNNPGRTPVQAGPSIGVYQNQQHFCYIRGSGNQLPADGTVYDSFYDGQNWQSQKIGNGGNTIFGNLNFSPPPVAPPFLVSIWDFASQQHFTYLAGSGSPEYKNNIVDAFYDGGSWHSQQLNNGGNTGAPSAYSKPSGCVFRPQVGLDLPPTNLAQQHVAYLAGDGSIWDVWFDGQTGHRWNAQKLNINASGAPFHTTNAPPAVTGPCVWVVPIDIYFEYHLQQHFTYLASGGELWDVWYNGPKNAWNAQKLNLNASRAPFHTTNAPRAVRGPAACVIGNVSAGKMVLEQHVAYPDTTGAIWNLWYDGGPQWQSRMVNLGESGAPAAVGDICLFYYEAVDTDGTIYGQLHFAWQAQGGEIWDAWDSLDPLPTGQPGGRG